MYVAAVLFARSGLGWTSIAKVEQAAENRPAWLSSRVASSRRIRIVSLAKIRVVLRSLSYFLNSPCHIRRPPCDRW